MSGPRVCAAVRRGRAPPVGGSAFLTVGCSRGQPAEVPVKGEPDMYVPEGATSFAAVVPLHAAAMMRLAAAVIGTADAEDVVQEASMRAWQSWSTLRNVEAVRPWLLQITL